MTDVVLMEVSDRIATVTLNRPEARNALNSEVLRLLPERLATADERDDVDVIVLTGADPAFCAGLDLKELGTAGSALAEGRGERSGSEGRSAHPDLAQTRRGPFPMMRKPVIGAINGVAVTGGLELALNCDFLVASERARFGDTHARVGVMPGWGLTVLLPQAIGVRRAREMSFTGNFLSADDAFHWGLVNRVVPHDELLPTVRSVAADIVGNDQAGVRQIRATYAAITAEDDAWTIEDRDARAWRAARFAPETVAARRAALVERGRRQP
jgi:enoyl-CoA hydratase